MPRKLLTRLLPILILLNLVCNVQAGLGAIGPFSSTSSHSLSYSTRAPDGSPWRSALPSPATLGTIDLLLQRATGNGLIYGGVVVIGNRGGILSVTSRGRIDSSLNAPLLDEHTMFDLASLTKVVATAPAVMKLLDQKKISLSDPLSRWFPEFRNSRHTITVLELLTHTSGLSDRHLLPHQSIHAVALRAAGKQAVHLPGCRFQYADINFILLAELVRRVSGKPLNVFCSEEFYAPLKMGKTMFLPPRDVYKDLAPSTGFAKGKPQDRDARRLGGVAGHAGLFSSAEDLSRYARLMLGRGTLEGRSVLSEAVIAEMTAPHACGGVGIERGLGWDIDSPFSAPKGTLFSEKSFGHTGYSGSSIWIDPELDLFVIILTNRRNFHDAVSFNQFRRDVSTIAAVEFSERGTSSVAFGQRAQSEVSRITASCLLQNNVAQKKTAKLSYGNRKIRDPGHATKIRKHKKMTSSRHRTNKKKGHRR